MTELVGDGPPGAEDLPLLGESLALDLVNSWYGIEPDVVDFLDDTWLRRWVGGFNAIHDLPVGGVGPADARPLRTLRDAAWTILHARVDGSQPPARAVAVLNDAARRSPTIVTLAWGPAGPTREVRPTGIHEALLVSRLAVATIELITGPDALRVRPCARPGCSMLFVQHHGHRRFCHPSCSQVMRQDRYRRRHPDARR